MAAAFAAVGIATETGQSIRSPASNAGIIGLAPTRGLISRGGVIPLSFTQDRVGIHTRTAADAVVLLSHLRGFDVEDLQTYGSLEAQPGTAASGGSMDIGGLRVGVLRQLFPVGPASAPGNALVDTALRHLRTTTTVVDGLTTRLDLEALIPSLRVNNFEVRFAFDAYLQRRGPTSPVRSLAALIATGKYLKDLDSRYNVAMKIASLDSDVEYLMRLGRQRDVRAALLDVMDRERLDVLAYPLKSLPAPPLGEAEVGGARQSVQCLCHATLPF